MSDVVAFLDAKHFGAYRVFNLYAPRLIRLFSCSTSTDPHLTLPLQLPDV